MVKINNKKIGIISGRFPKTNFHSQINHKLYADKYDYTYIHCNFPSRTSNPYMNKINYLIAYCHLFDYLFWIDDDAFFFDFNQDIIKYLPSENKFFSCCSSPSFKELKTVISSGQFFIKCDEIGIKFLNMVINTNLSKVKEWWQERHGYFSNGDQDAMVYLIETNSLFKGKVDIYDYKCFNSRVENIIDGIDVHTPLILHFTGKQEIKWKNYLLVQKTLNLGECLVKKSEKIGYSFVDEPPPIDLIKKIFLKIKKIIGF